MRSIYDVLMPEGMLYKFTWNPQGCRPVARELAGRKIVSCSHRWKSDSEGVWYPITWMRAASEGEVVQAAPHGHGYLGWSA